VLYGVWKICFSEIGGAPGQARIRVKSRDAFPSKRYRAMTNAQHGFTGEGRVAAPGASKAWYSSIGRKF
jgi:hypothetical protein